MAIEDFGSLVEVAVDLIDECRFQSRLRYDDEAQALLENSIKESGIKEALKIRPQGERFELISGSRRLKALRTLGRPVAPCIIEKADDAEAAVENLLENVPRESLSAMEIALGLERAAGLYTQMKGFGPKAAVGVVAARTGVAASKVDDYVRICGLQQAVREEAITEGWTLNRCLKELRTSSSKSAQVDDGETVNTQASEGIAEDAKPEVTLPPARPESESRAAGKPAGGKSAFTAQEVERFFGNLLANADGLAQGLAGAPAFVKSIGVLDDPRREAVLEAMKSKSSELAIELGKFNRLLGC